MGTTGGTVNQITKQPMGETFTRIGAGLGTDSYRRLTLDTNQPLDGIGNGSAFRLNLMAHENDVPERKGIERQRWGLAPSLALGLSSSDERLSSRAGLVFKPLANGRIYVAWGNSFNPSAENLATSGAGLSEATQKLGPEKNETWELGTKWELMDSRLELDAAIFQVEKENARVTMADGSTALAGDRRVQGFELSASGKLTDEWSLFANFTYLDSETRKDANTPKGLATVGQALANTPPRSFNLWTTYDLPGNVRVGYGTHHVSERNLTSSDDRIKLDGYWLHNAMLGYKASENLDLQLNLNNLFDKDYVERVRTTLGNAARSSAVEYGDARSAVFSATLSF
ncbi:Vitamin B12 transporter BtuB [compost metagenome]|jgi:catecholate siderophore receptor